MRIGLLSHQFPGARAGGVGTYTLQAATALANAGHQIHVFTLTLPADLAIACPHVIVPQNSAGTISHCLGNEQSARLFIHTTPDLASRVLDNALPAPLAAAVESGGEAVYRLAIGWLLCEAARAFHRSGGGALDLLEGPEYEALGLPLLLKPEPDLPVVTHLHLCSAIGRAGNAAATTPADALIDALELSAIALADALCAPTQNIVNETRRLTHFAQSVATFPHPMALPAHHTFAPPAANAPILFVGRLEPRKGTELFPAAFNRFLSRNPDATIRLVGSDTQWPAGQSVRARITAGLDPAVRDRVIFAGEKSPADIPAEFAGCRFSICPSLFESFAYVAAESLIAGRPVVVSSDIGATDVVAEAGVVFERGNAEALAAAMEKLHRQPALLADLSHQAFHRACTLFSPESTIAARVDFYQRAAADLRAKGRTAAAARLAALDSHHLAPLLEALSALTGTLAGAPSAAPLTPGARLLAILDQLSPSGAAVLLYGAGRHTSRLLAQRHLWESRGHRVAGLIDDHPRFANAPTHLGLPICSSAALLARAKAGQAIPPIVLSTDTFQDQFWQQTAPLRALGIQVFRLYA